MLQKNGRHVADVPVVYPIFSLRGEHYFDGQVLISMFTKRASETQLQGLTYFSQSPEQIAETRNSWSNWDILTTIIVVLVCVAFYAYFW